MAETWKPIPDWEGYYEVSDRGKVRGITREITRSDGRIVTVKGREKAFSEVSGGYFQAHLWKDGKPHYFYVHLLVMRTFVGPRPRGLEICHNDGNPKNNLLSNLRYDTVSENRLDTVRHGRHKGWRGGGTKSHCPRNHPLVPPNLAAYALRRGERTCLACSRTAGYVRLHPDLKESFKQVSDKYFKALMEKSTT